MKRKLKAKEPNVWLQTSQWLKLKFWGEKAETDKRSKENKEIELMVESLLQESQNYNILESPGMIVVKFAPGLA